MNPAIVVWRPENSILGTIPHRMIELQFAANSQLQLLVQNVVKNIQKIRKDRIQSAIYWVRDRNCPRSRCGDIKNYTRPDRPKQGY